MCGWLTLKLLFAKNKNFCYNNNVKNSIMWRDFQMNKNEVIYVVTYVDDRNRKHLITVKGFSQVRFLEERFGRIHYEVTENYVRTEQGM